MSFKKILSVGLLLAAAVTMAVQAVQMQNAGNDRGQEIGQQANQADRDAQPTVDPLVRPAKEGLQARVPKPKKPFVRKPERTLGRLVVKFGDSVRARLNPNGKVVSTSNYGFSLNSVEAVRQQFDLTFESAVPQSEQYVQERLIERAEARSRRMQPDIKGLHYVYGPESSLQQAAEALNALDVVEFVEWDLENDTADGASTGGTGACCLPDGTCTGGQTQQQCQQAGGQYQGDGTTCSNALCGACCDPDIIGQDCVLTDTAAICTGFGGTFTADGTPCGECEEGACCLPDDSCVETTQFDCVENQGGEFVGGPCGMDTCAAATGACCLPPVPDDPGACQILAEDVCVASGGYFWGEDSTCMCGPDGDEFTCEQLDLDGCGQPQSGWCFNPDGTCTPGCTTNSDAPFGPDGAACGDDATQGAPCCDFICDLDPYCCGESDLPGGGYWDAHCAYMANQICAPFFDPQRCETPTNESCFEAHPEGGGCSNSACCELVADSLPSCSDSWTDDCVELAEQLCVAMPAGGGTPDFTPLQGHLTESTWQPGAIPSDLVGTVPVFTQPCGPNAGNDFVVPGFNGEGWAIDETGDGRAGEPFTDQNGNNWWDPGEPFEDVGLDGEPGTMDFGEGDNQWNVGQGMNELGLQLLYQYGINNSGLPNDEAVDLARGKTIKVGIIEWSFYTGHEDLDVIIEPGQTIIEEESIVGATVPDHGTATLSLATAKDNGFGVIGVAPEAQAYFFPLAALTSDGTIEAREEAAWVSAIGEFDAGDVISASYGPADPCAATAGVTGNLNNVETMNMLFGVASDIGIAVCVSAGNSSINLDNAPDEGDSGAFVVGASSPGTPHYRLGFSNYYTEPDPNLLRSNIVHINAWGSNVVSAGYGSLYSPNLDDGTGDDVTREYSLDFGGTSAASPLVAGAIANIQGLSKQIHGIPLSIGQLRSVLGLFGFNPPGQPNRFFNGKDDNVCRVLDTNPDADQSRIGPFSNPHDAIINLVTQGNTFGDSSLVQEILVLKGEHLFGNIFSVRALDGNYFVVRTELTAPGDDPNAPESSGIDTGVPIGPSSSSNLGPANAVDYIASGETVDLLIEAHPQTPPDQVQTISVASTFQPLPTTFGLLMSQMWDWNQRRWVFVDFATIAGGGDDGDDPPVPGAAFTVADASRFANPDDGRILTRQYVFTFGQTSGPGAPSGDPTKPIEVRLDFFDMAVNEGFGLTGDNGTGPGGGAGQTP